VNDEALPLRRSFFITDRTHTPAGTVLIALLGGAGLGLLAWWLQGVLPDPWGTLANTSALWGLAGFAAAALQGARRWLAVAAGTLALLGMVIMFALLDGATMIQWVAYLLVGAVAGALFGLAGSLARSSRSTSRLTAAATVGGVIAGEGLYGIVIVDASGPQWWFELLLGIVIAVLVTRARRERVVALGLVTVVAAALLGAYLAYDAVLA
jgi:hypothetical protein